MMPTEVIRPAAIQALGLRAPTTRIELNNSIAIDWFVLDLPAWRGPRLDSLGGDCRKGSSLVTGKDGLISCTEVEVVRRLNADASDLVAGWVQAWPCGRDTWRSWIWPKLPPAFADRNELIQRRLQRRATALGGHPDVGVQLGDETFYIECKVYDPIDKQLDWIGAGIELGLVRPDQVIVVQAFVA